MSSNPSLCVGTKLNGCSLFVHKLAQSIFVSVQQGLNCCPCRHNSLAKNYAVINKRGGSPEYPFVTPQCPSSFPTSRHFQPIHSILQHIIETRENWIPLLYALAGLKTFTSWLFTKTKVTFHYESDPTCFKSYFHHYCFQMALFKYVISLHIQYKSHAA